MGNAARLSAAGVAQRSTVTERSGTRGYRWPRSAPGDIPSASKLIPFAYSLTDQALAVGGGFLANVALARAQTKQEYGMFALSYSFYVFLTGIHNAVVLEPYTVYGSGRYREYFSEYLRLLAKCNAVLDFSVSAVLFLAYLLLLWLAPQWASRSLLGLAVSVVVLLSGLFLRRAFYVQGQPALAAKTSLVFFVAVTCALWLTLRFNALNSFSTFVLLAAGWIVAGATFVGKLTPGRPVRTFLELEPDYWREHWNYTRWVLATAFVFQFMTQGYYWLLAGFLSVTEVGELRAMYMLVAPVEQVLVAISFIVLPALAGHYAGQRFGNFLSLWKRGLMGIAGLTGFFALCVRILGKRALHIIYAGKFDGLAPLLYVLALSPLFIGAGVMMMNALNAAEKPKLVFYGYLSSAAATFLLGIPLVSRWGLRGATYGMLLSGATCVVAMTVGFLLKVSRNAPGEDGPTHISGSSWQAAGGTR